MKVASSSNIVFKSKMFGFDKAQVQSYLKKMVLEHEHDLQEKKDELSSVKKKNEQVEARLEELEKKLEELSSQKNKVADILLAVQEKANAIEQDTIKSCEEKKALIEQEINKKVEEKNGINKDIEGLKTEIVDVLDKYKKQLESVSTMYKEIEAAKALEDQIS